MEATRFTLLCILILSLVEQHLGFDRDDYEVCTSGLLENTGYSSIMVDDVSYWSHCGFPNPRFNLALCGRLENPEANYYVCDPDDVISRPDLNDLDDSLDLLYMKTPHQCTTIQNERMNFILLLVIVKNLQTPDLSHASSCINSCYEIKPTLTVGDRNATTEEKEVALDSFAQGLIDDWAGMFCNNTVVTVYWSEEHKMATATGELAQSRLLSGRISSVQNKALDLIADGNITEGFEYLVNEYKVSLIGFSPAYILLAIFMGLMVLVAALMIAGFGFSKSSVGGYWDEGKLKMGLKAVLKAICGVWLIEGLFMALIRLQEKARLWWAVVPFAGFISCLVVAMTVEFTTVTVNGTTTEA